MSALFLLAQQLQRAAQDQLIPELVPSEPEGGGGFGERAAQKDAPGSKPPSSKFQRGLNAGPQVVHAGFEGEIQKSGLIRPQLPIFRCGSQGRRRSPDTPAETCELSPSRSQMPSPPMEREPRVPERPNFNVVPADAIFGAKGSYRGGWVGSRGLGVVKHKGGPKLQQVMVPSIPEGASLGLDPLVETETQQAGGRSLFHQGVPRSGGVHRVSRDVDLGQRQ